MHSVKTNLSDEGANSTLFVARVNKSDSGNYTCTIGPTLYFTTNVHVLNGKLFSRYFLQGKCLRLKNDIKYLLMMNVDGNVYKAKIDH